MKNISFFVITIVICSSNLKSSAELLASQPDATYLKTIKKIEHLLKSEISHHRFTNDEGVPSNYLIADLTDSLNIGKKYPSDMGTFIKFIDGHFYHVVPALKYISYSFIIYIEKGKMKVFKYVNCTKRGNSLQDVIEFAANKLINNKDKEGVIRRIKNYRSSIEFPIQMDNYSASEPINCN